MKPNKASLCLCILIVGLAGCGPSKTERDARERERLKLEEQTRQEVQKGNQAITDMNKKAFGKKPEPKKP